MCGLAGLRRFDGQEVPAPLIHEMTDALAHRGPDADGFWSAPGIAVGHRRLSIIDLAGSPQPMRSADGRHVLVFNGEIFNYQQLRAGLDYPFTTHGDTEVLLAGLIAQGPAFLARVHGQFAFALFDTVTGELLLGRDPAGVIPLYYHQDRDGLAFGSEVKAILPAMSRVAVDLASLDAYLARSAVPAPWTLFEGVRKVLPGHTLRVDARGTLTAAPYWTLPEGPPARISHDEARERVRTALTDSVREALVADVPVGSYLSGGLDSSLVVALVRSLHPDAQLATFSAGFGDPRYDELPWARRVADLLHTDHHEVMVTPTDFVDLWPTLTWHRDAPLSQPADVAVYLLAKLARTRVKVVLSGEGSDELFAGYNKYQYVQAVEAANIVPARLRAAAYGRLRNRLPRNVEIVARAAAAGDRQARMESWFAPFGPAAVRALLGDTAAHPEPPWTYTGDAVNRQLQHDFRTWLPDNLLERGDRMSMAASLELRPPFLGRDLIDTAFALPSSVKVRRGSTKWIVKQVGAELLPAEVCARPKVGFRVPLDDWFRTGLVEMARDLLLARDSFAYEVFHPGAVRALVDRHQSGASNEESRLWTLLGLEVWHRRFFRG